MENSEPTYNWYASKVFKARANIVRSLEKDAVHYYQTRFAPGLLFIYCHEDYVRQLTEDHWGKIYFYRDPTKTKVQPVSTREMNTFILVTSVTDDLILIDNPTPRFLQGQRVRVTEGLFRGAEGVIKRIKGDRRLVVSINGVMAVATCYIRPEFLEKVEEEKPEEKTS